jgi:hypothetical protein
MVLDDVTISDIVNDLWPGSHVQLAHAAGMARNTLRRVMRADYKNPPQAHLITLLRVLEPKLRRYKVTLTIDDMLAAYLRQEARRLDDS